MRTATAVIVEDEPALAAWLAKLLKKLWPELEILAVSENGVEAKQVAEQLKPDIVFLDIHLPGCSGLDMAATITGNTHIVFVTSYDQYAINAFEKNAIDYLLKPVEEDRLKLTINRLHEKLNAIPENYAELFKKFALPTNDYYQWIQVSNMDSIEFIPAEEVEAFVSNNKLTRCLTNTEKQYLMKTTLIDLEPHLDPKIFWRVHRNAIVNISAIEKVTKDSLGLLVKLKHHSKPLEVSRSQAWRFKGL